MTTASLDTIAAKFRNYSQAQIRFALADIRETLAIHRNAPPSDPYVAKLLADWDYLIVRAR